MFEPDFGYSSPRRTPEKCKANEFTDPRRHRVGLFAVRYDGDGLPGYLVERRCVGCGRAFGRFFKPSRRLESNRGEMEG